MAAPRNNLAPSSVVSEIPLDLGHLPVFECYGDPDDHLRLSVLLASSFETAEGVGISSEVEVCRDPSTSWSRRLQAIDHLLREARPSRDQHMGILFDLDALDPGPLDVKTRWDDREFRGARGELFRILRQSIQRGGWVLVRPNPSAAISLSGEPAPVLNTPRTPEEIIAALAPEHRALAESVIRRGVLTSRQLARRFHATGDDVAELGRDLVSLVYNALPENAAATALRVSAARPPQSWNGALGPFALADTDVVEIANVVYEDDQHVARAAVHELLDWGFLRFAGPARVRMPRDVRSFLHEQARLVFPEVAARIHRWLSSADLEKAGPGDLMEAHHHAIEVSPALPADVERAKSTARYYRSTLREMAVRMSTMEERYPEAASLFEHIVQEDSTDAYAWEYLGYNLARSYRDKPIPPSDADRIERAYSNAIFHNPDNPLYEGRLIGFRARVGAPIEPDFSEKLRAYLDPSAPREAVNYFATTALDGMSRDVRRRVLDRWRPRLEGRIDLTPYLREGE